jgi:hypothetical protein
LSKKPSINTYNILPDMNSTPEQLRFASIPGLTVRADFEGGGLSSWLTQKMRRMGSSHWHFTIIIIKARAICH